MWAVPSHRKNKAGVHIDSGSLPFALFLNAGIQTEGKKLTIR